MVRHEVLVEPDGTVDVDTDHEGNMLADLEFQNKVCCNMLTSTFRQKLETLSQSIFDLDKTLMITDIP